MYKTSIQKWTNMASQLKLLFLHTNSTLKFSQEQERIY